MTTATIDQDRLDRFFREITLRSGKGKGVNGDADVCAVQAADWLAGGNGQTDSPECVCPVIRAYVIALNDSSMFADHRDELKSFVPRIIGTRGDLFLMVKRAQISAAYADDAAAKSAESAAESAEFAAESAEFAAKSAEYAAKSAEYAAKSAASAAESAESAAESAESAAESAESAAESAESAAESAAIRSKCLDCLNAMINMEFSNV